MYWVLRLLLYMFYTWAPEIHCYTASCSPPLFRCRKPRYRGFLRKSFGCTRSFSSHYWRCCSALQFSRTITCICVGARPDSPLVRQNLQISDLRQLALACIKTINMKFSKKLCLSAVLKRSTVILDFSRVSRFAICASWELHSRQMYSE